MKHPDNRVLLPAKTESISNSRLCLAKQRFNDFWPDNSYWFMPENIIVHEITAFGDMIIIDLKIMRANTNDRGLVIFTPVIYRGVGILGVHDGGYLFHGWTYPFGNHLIVFITDAAALPHSPVWLRFFPVSIYPDRFQAIRFQLGIDIVFGALQNRAKCHYHTNPYGNTDDTESCTQLIIPKGVISLYKYVFN